MGFQTSTSEDLVDAVDEFVDMEERHETFLL
jgi:uncharacterized LabA/DUF88 family protein